MQQKQRIQQTIITGKHTNAVTQIRYIQLSRTEISAILAQHDLHGRDNLLTRRRRDALRVQGPRTGVTEVVNHRLVGGDVATHGTERLGKCPHEDVDVLGIDTSVLANTTAVSTQRTDAVSFIYIQVALHKIQERQ